MTAKINFNLATYPRFEQYEEKLDKQLQNLKNQLTLKEEELSSLQQEYITQFAAGEEPVKTTGQINNAKAVISMLKDEIELIEGSDLKEKALAAAVYEEYRATERKTLDARENLWNSAIALQRETDAKIAEIELEYLQLANDFNAITARQFVSVIDHLELDAENKKSLSQQASNNPIPGWARFNNIKAYVNLVH